MRDFKGIKRQRSRNRNGGSGAGGGVGGKTQHNANRAFDSNGPEGAKVRGAAQHVYEKYQQLARDAQTAGDRVLAENYLQHSEHYFRLMRAMQPQRPLSEIIGRDQFVSGYDIDFEDESGGDIGESEPFVEGGDGVEVVDRQPRTDNRDVRRDERPRDDYRSNDRPNDRPRDDYRQNDPRGREDQQQPRQDRGGQDRGFNDRPVADRVQNDRSQSDRPRQDRPRDERPREERAPRAAREDRPRFNREDRPARLESSERDPMIVTEPESTPLTVRAPGHQLRGDDGQVSDAPAFLQVRPSEPRVEAVEEVRKPRRRRAPVSFVETPGVEGAAALISEPVSEV